MKSYIYLFPFLLFIISCKRESQCKLQGLSNPILDKIYDNLDATSFRTLLEKADYYDKYFASAPTLTDTINDEIARLMVKRDLKRFSGGIDIEKTRSVFFDLKKLHSILSTVRDLDYDTLGLRIYFAKYNSQDSGVLKYLQDKFKWDLCKDYDGNRTLVLQFMNNTNERYIYQDAVNKKYLLNFNLGELCPPCNETGTMTGKEGDWYIK